MFTEKVRYILKVLAYLCVDGTEEYVTMDQLSDNLAIPRGYLNKVIPELVEHGYVDSKKGVGGGVRLACSAEQIEVREVLENIGALEHRTSQSDEACCVPELFEDCMIDRWMSSFKEDVLGDITFKQLTSELR
ncbi:MAG: Rrf2 family transcriptional regulator [bacterium]